MGNKRKYLVYSLFALSVLYGVWFHFIKSDNNSESNSSGIIQTAITSTNSESNVAFDAGTPVPNLASMGPSSVPEEWGRDPFLVYNTAEIAANNYTESSAYSEPKLTGISYHHDGPSYAIINNKLLQINDLIDGWQVVSILNDHVLIEKSGVTKKLMMGEMP